MGQRVSGAEVGARHNTVNMSLLVHSPARIVQELLVDRGQATHPSSPGVWPAYSDAEPDQPDEVIHIIDTDAPDYFRLQPTGEVAGHSGITLKFRSTTDGLANQKACQIAQWIAETVYQFGVTIDGVRYLVDCFVQIGNVIPLGKDKNNSRRSRRQLSSLVSIYTIPED